MTNLATFTCLLRDCEAPEPADRSLQGQAPLRALRHCLPFVEASSFGWWMKSPVTFHMRWDGHRIFWRMDEAQPWSELTHAQIPGSTTHFDAHTSEEMHGLIPPFLSALPERGVVQVWSGWAARTRPGWSLLVRGIANKVPDDVCFTMEGIVEFDQWPGPVFSNVQFLQSGRTITFRKGEPFLQIQPVMSPRRLRTAGCGIQSLRLTDDGAGAELSAYRESVLRRTRESGAYKRKILAG